MKDVEIAVDSLGRDGHRGDSQSGNIPGRLIEQQGLLDSETDLDLPLAGLLQLPVRCLKLGRSPRNALLQLGVERADFFLGPFALSDV